MKHMAEKGKIDIKSGILGVKSETRKTKWCKIQVLGLKIDKYQGAKS